MRRMTFVVDAKRQYGRMRSELSWGVAPFPLLPAGRMKKKFLSAVLACLCIWTQAALAQQEKKSDDQDKPIQLKTELVEMRVVVTDKQGKVVDNLRREDFEILEENVPQTIDFFSIERVEEKLRSLAQAPEPTSVKAQTQKLATPPARTIVLFVDNLHLSVFSFNKVKNVLKQFIKEKVTDQDVVALIPSSGTLGVLQQFMRDRKMLLYAVDKLTRFNQPDTNFTAHLAAQVVREDDRAISVALRILGQEEAYVALSQESARAYAIARGHEILANETGLRMTSLQTLRAVSDRLAEMPGQRMVVFLSDGFTVYDRDGITEHNELQAVTGRAARSGVVIYALDAKGLMAPTEHTATGIASADFGLYMAQSQREQQSILQIIAGDTGGKAFLNRTDLNLPLGKILDDNNVYYSLAFYPSENNDKKKFRKVTVRVKNHPDYEVRSQKGYMPTDTKKAEAMAQMTPRQTLMTTMLQPLPVTAIPVLAQADYLEAEGDDAQVSLQVRFDGEPVGYSQKDDKYDLKCEVVITAFDKSGKIVTSLLDTIKGTMTAEQVEQAKKSGYRYSKRVSLKPGLYQLRVGVRDENTNQIGTSMSWVEIPDLKKGKLALSSLFLGKQSNPSQTQAVKGQDKKSTNNPYLVVGKASFKPGETVFYRLVVYNPNNSDKSPSEAAVKVEIIQGEKTVYAGDWQPLAAKTIRQDKKGNEVGGQLQLGLEPGIYELKVSVKSGKSKKAVEQITLFEIES